MEKQENVSDELDYYYLLYKLVNSDSYWIVIKTKNINDIREHAKRHFKKEEYLILKAVSKFSRLLSNERKLDLFNIDESCLIINKLK